MFMPGSQGSVDGITPYTGEMPGRMVLGSKLPEVFFFGGVACRIAVIRSPTLHDMPRWETAAAASLHSHSLTWSSSLSRAAASFQQRVSHDGMDVTPAPQRSISFISPPDRVGGGGVGGSISFVTPDGGVGGRGGKEGKASASSSSMKKRKAAGCDEAVGMLISPKD